MSEAMGRIIKVKIRKPLYGTFVYIRETIINNAIRKSAKIAIEIPRGIGIVDPIKWKKTGKRMEKVFNFPDNPMVLYGNYVPIETKGEVKKPEKENKIDEEKEVQLTLF